MIIKLQDITHLYQYVIIILVQNLNLTIKLDQNLNVIIKKENGVPPLRKI